MNTVYNLCLPNSLSRNNYHIQEDNFMKIVFTAKTTEQSNGLALEPMTNETNELSSEIVITPKMSKPIFVAVIAVSAIRILVTCIVLLKFVKRHRMGNNRENCIICGRKLNIIWLRCTLILLFL